MRFCIDGALLCRSGYRPGSRGDHRPYLCFFRTTVDWSVFRIFAA